MLGEAPRDASSSSDSDSGSTDNESADETAVETLVAGRERRATAGNRLLSLLEREGDDELELLFAEDEEEEDVEFEGAEGEDASDVQLDSSSDDEDQGPAKANDDLEGERELQRQDRVERNKNKRKAADLFKKPPSSRKKVKIDPTAAPAAPSTPAPRPKKKSERVSWIPTPDEGPTRSSSRKQTVQNKEDIHARMKESEKRRLKQIAIMDAAAKRKEASKPKAMTQADRLAEAARTEKKNAKSLNRWEETERKRSEEQKARLAALHNRQLEGPVISWWSGLAKWVNGKLVKVGVKKEGNEDKGGQERSPNEGGKSKAAIQDGDTPVKAVEGDTVISDAPTPQPPVPPTFSLPEPAPRPNTVGQQQIRFAPPQGPHGFLDGIHYYASLPLQEPQHPQAAVVAAPGLPPIYTDQLPSPLKPVAPVTEYSARNLVILENMDANAVRTPELQNHALIKKRTGKLQSKRWPSGPVISPRFSLTWPGRTEPRALRDHDAGSPVPRSPDGTRLRQLIRLPGDPATPPRRISVEQSPRMLRGAGWQCGTRGARAVLEAFSVGGGSGNGRASKAGSGSGSGAADRLISPQYLRHTSIVRVRPTRYQVRQRAADVATRPSDAVKYRRTGCRGNDE
ncbi:MAG: hypothetical protein LQ347_005226 [Umbilicaria vellea]|nr:MAG: hypothetical protein LQ347_005226 [Umbilicaria vellea]